MDTQSHSAGGLEQDQHVEKKPSYMHRVKAKAKKIRDSIGSKMQNHDNETDEEDQFLDAPEKVPKVHGEPKHESPEVKTGSDNLNSGTTPSNLAEHRDAETTPREYGEMGAAPEPKRYSTQHEHAESCPTGLNFGEKTNTEKTKTNLGSVEEPKTDLDVSSTPLEVEKAAVIREIDSRPTLDFDDEPSVEVPLEAEKTAVILELNSTIPRIDSEKLYKWNLESNSEVSPQLEAEKAAVITEINSSITRMESEKPYTTSLETNFSPVSTPLEADKENARSTWMDFEKENAEQPTDHFGTDHPKLTDLKDADKKKCAKEADVEPMTRSFGDIDITGKPEPTGTDGHDKFSFDSITHPIATNEAKTQENTEDFYETKSDNMNVDEEPNVNPTYTENKPSAPSAIAATAASTIAGTAVSAKDTFPSKLGYNGNDNSNTVPVDAKVTDKDGASIGEETKSSTPSVGDYEKFGGSGTGDVSNMTGTEKGTEGVDFVTDQNAEKISHGDEGKPLLEVFSEVMRKPKEEFPEKVADNMDKVTESPAVTKRLGTDERGYERDEDESFGTDGGSFGAAGMESPAVSKMGEQVKEHDAGVMHKPKEEFPEKVAENVDKVTELPEAATRLGIDERGYERDEGESFGTDGGSFGAAGMESPAVSKRGEQVKEHDARVMLEKVAENKVTDSPEVAARLGTDERGYERDDDDSFGTAPVSTGGGLESPTANVGMVDRARGLVNYYWFGNEANNGNEAAVKPDDDIHKVADGGAEEKKQGESHETSTTGVVGQK